MNQTCDNNGNQNDNKQIEQKVATNYQHFSLFSYSISLHRVTLKSLFSHESLCVDLIKPIPI